MARRIKPAANLSLFESENSQTVSDLMEKNLASVAPIPSVAIDACPRCGRAGLRSVRPMEYGGLTHYCPQCAGTEPGEPFRWKP